MHFHLTEDQGWRIEIKKYPKLTSVGSIRTEGDEIHDVVGPLGNPTHIENFGTVTKISRISALSDTT